MQLRLLRRIRQAVLGQQEGVPEDSPCPWNSRFILRRPINSLGKRQTWLRMLPSKLPASKQLLTEMLESREKADVTVVQEDQALS